MGNKNKAHYARFNGMKTQKFSMLAMLSNGLFYMPQAEIARMLGISKRTLQYWLADEEYKEVERLYNKVKEEGNQLDIRQVEELIA